MSKHNFKTLPNHIAFIIDGNGRWAKERGLTRSAGHKKGFLNLKKRVSDCFDLGIKCVSAYCFSTENWNRPKKEVEYLRKLIIDICNDKSFNFDDKKIRLNVMGDYTKFGTEVTEAVNAVLERTKDYDNFVLNIAVNYGSRDELARAFNLMQQDGLTNITPEDIDNYLYTKGLPVLDYCVRTSGELRLSNFMLYQMAYAEMYFPKAYWPAFTKKDLYIALESFAKRKRKFGAIKEE